MARSHRDATTVVHAGLSKPRQGAPLLEGPTFAGPFHLSGDPSSSDYQYGRYGNPTWSAYEGALSELEGGQCVVFASGMAAVSALLLSRLGPGDALVLPSDGYPAVRAFAQNYLNQRGVETRLVATDTDKIASAIGGASMLWLETPSNPSLAVCDVAYLASCARSEGAVVAVDNTLATPLGQRPLELGAHYSVASDSKHITGHSDLVLGHVACASDTDAGQLTAFRTQTGSIAGPFETWLAHRSLATLDVRLGRQTETAQYLAQALSERDQVLEVRYPGLEHDPSHVAAAKQMRHFGTVVSVCLESRGHAERFLGSLRLITETTSFGGVHSVAERRARWPGEVCDEGLVRVSVGLEDREDLLTDIDCALRLIGE
jgi:cystathionine gamma-lyase